MQFTKIIVRYGEKRSENYQSIDLSAEVEVMLEEGDDLKSAFDNALRQLAKPVRASADKAIERYQK
jgi:hypothetical protein